MPGTGNTSPSLGILQSGADTSNDIINKGSDLIKAGLNSEEYKNGKEFAKSEFESIGNFFNISSGDGTQSPLDAQIAMRDGGNTLTAYAHFDLNATPGKTSAKNFENTVSASGSIFYNTDFDSTSYTPKNKDGGDEAAITLGPRPYSVFNKYSLVNFRGTPLSPEGDSVTSPSFNKIPQTSLINPTASKIIEMTSAAGVENFGYRFDYSDFALSKYFGKIPNNMMLTLRRFAFPVGDDIVSPKGIDGTETKQPDIARAVTYMGESTGNSLGDIIKFSHGFNWKNAEAQVQTLNSQKEAKAGKLGGIINGSSFLSGLNAASQGLNAFDAAKKKANGGFDAFSNTYPNHVFGPLNVIKEVMVREQGLKFDQEFTLKFEYELRDLGGANAKILMLDQLSNLLALTYNNAPFWGGSVRYIGSGSIAQPIGDLKHIKNGDYTAFLGSVIKGLGKGASNIFNDIKGAIFDGKDSKLLNNMLGGSIMKMMNSPQGGQAVASLLTGDPTGQWHLTIGNPLNPIAVIGNLGCQDTEIKFDGPIGPHDFPEKMTVTIKLKPGRPRDKSEIESMFNAGKGRFYVQPSDAADVNNTMNVSAYGNKDKKTNKYTNTFRKITNG